MHSFCSGTTDKVLSIEIPRRNSSRPQTCLHLGQSPKWHEWGSLVGWWQSDLILHSLRHLDAKRLSLRNFCIFTTILLHRIFVKQRKTKVTEMLRQSQFYTGIILTKLVWPTEAVWWLFLCHTRPWSNSHRIYTSLVTSKDKDSMDLECGGTQATNSLKD